MRLSLSGLALGAAGFVVMGLSAILVLVASGESTGPGFVRAAELGVVGIALFCGAVTASATASSRRARLSRAALVMSVASLPVVVVGYSVALFVLYG